MFPPEISIIISTYNAEAWLEKVLWSYQAQTFKNFEIVIADDGSKQPTLDLIKKMRKSLDFSILHIWHEDHGFRKCKILNKAILNCNAEYIIMSDGDCIARKDFVEVHHKEKKEGCFLSGGYFMLPMDISIAIKREDILNQKCFDLEWLIERGLKKSFKNNKLTSKSTKARLLNAITPTNSSWNGHNASGWKKDILAVNGFDERMQYGGEDREMGERLLHLGIKSKQVRYSAICLHLDHSRGYVTPEMILNNKAIRKITRAQKIVSTPFGIKKK